MTSVSSTFQIRWESMLCLQICVGRLLFVFYLIPLNIFYLLPKIALILWKIRMNSGKILKFEFLNYTYLNMQPLIKFNNDIRYENKEGI